MSGKEEIIAKILSDAQHSCDMIACEARLKSSDLIRKQEELMDKGKAKLELTAATELKETIKRRCSVAELEVKKYILFLKQQLLQTCFDEAKQQILSMPKEQYIDFLAQILKQNAENGDCITIAKKDKGFVTQQMIDKAVGKKQVSFNSSYGDFDAGIYFSQKAYDKDCTLDCILSQVREHSEGEIANLLFEVK